MSKRMKLAIPVALAAVFSLALAPQAADAQERTQEQQQDKCTVEVAPERVPSGQAAVSVTARLSQGIGQITELRQKDGNLALATPEDIGKAEMARTEEGQEPRPVKMARTGNQATVWLNTENAEAGAHPFVLEGENGECSGRIQVEGQQQESPGQDDS